MPIQEIVTEIPAIDISNTKTASASITLVNNDSSENSIVKISAFNGTLFFVNRPKYFGAMPSFDIDHSNRVDAYKHEFPTDNIAVKITKFIMPAAYGTPAIFINVTKGLSSSPSSDDGKMADSTIIEAI